MLARLTSLATSFAVLQSPGTTLAAEGLERVVVQLSGASVGCLVFGARLRSGTSSALRREGRVTRTDPLSTSCRAAA